MAKSDSKTGASASTDHQSAARKLMSQFDKLPPAVRAALSEADQPSDQMIDILCTMHKSGFAESAMLKIIAASNTKGG